jgi:hypothetical protein
MEITQDDMKKLDDKIKRLLEKEVKQKEYQKKQYVKNKEKIIAKVYNEAHKEEKLKHDREYYQEEQGKAEGKQRTLLPSPPCFLRKVYRYPS